MMKIKRTLLYAILMLASACFAERRDIAVTVDDFPFISGNTQQIQMVHQHIADALQNHQAPATFFVIVNRLNTSQQQNQLLQLKQQGFGIGNHTFSHLSLRHTSVPEYILDIDKADKILAPMMSTPKYFRYPYLAQGRWWWNRRKVYAFLAKEQYVIAPITVDSRDFEFNLRMGENLDKGSLEKLKKEYLGFVWAQTLKAEHQSDLPRGRQILLIHTNLLNGLFLQDLLQMYEKKGYHFISLTDALKTND
ncbi:MAG: polysaccharide deacetylase family protein [Legionellales bacterium]|nr:polysaccharide deacetylase family protein [Legionellales bacterium]